jgi:hypothetical protein
MNSRGTGEDKDSIKQSIGVTKSFNNSHNYPLRIKIFLEILPLQIQGIAEKIK